ncbi:aminodeoxychorismate synthase component I [Kineococcus rubinsiae]|uniref:aminodeoxychorismate synthase component I n=1 Tax=Kineococcus rubinsiae TaxID=2609562 RepID=UPI001430C928|nr:aminodeoxychorismate synthase component I [Kineococcus rubinsiae]NIZ90590.1 aminodeoxychorismate synthase component I [Kineococcus rubinsiae]
MRVLLVDNHDSYTFNVFQLLAEVTGEEPVVVLNDGAAPGELDLEGFDAVVLSPGPGHPGVAADFGLCADVLARARVPVLGICLGHQGIALAAGAPVVRAPRARHGHVSRITHDGTGLFAGLPQEFAAVRYHSLAVPEPLPPTLVATAWAEDGVVMALRHTERPFVGVQFHPESIESEHGAVLVRNFLRAAHPPARTTSSGPPTSSGTPAAARRTYRLHVRTLPRAVDTEAAFDRLNARSAQAFWLDSARTSPATGRFSFLGDAAGPEAEFLTYRVADVAVRVRDRDGERLVPGSVFDLLEAELAARRIDPADRPQDLPFDFAGGYVGYLGYELRADCGYPTTRTASTPDSAWVFADRFLAVDHEQGRTHLLALSRSDLGAGEPATAARAWLDATEAALADLPDDTRPSSEPGASVTAVTGAAVEPLLRRDRAGYLADVARCGELLRAGESYEICLTDEVRLPVTADPLSTYRRLRRANPAPYAAFLRFDDVEVACASPERFLTVDRDRWAEARPVKGTAARGATPAEDEELRGALERGAKTRAENLMIVDLLRNDLGRVCEVGSVSVPALMVTETYATVHQLVSTVRGRLRAGTSVVAAVRACFPGGSMTGAPKERTLRIIDELEQRPRGIYSGALGYLSLTGTADLNIVIRTLVAQGGEWTAGAGGAIVLDSDPVGEFEELLLKAAASLQAVLPPEPQVTTPA